MHKQLLFLPKSGWIIPGVVLFFLLLAGISFRGGLTAKKPMKPGMNFVPASDHRIQYTGRILFSDPSLPKFWQPGVYLRTRFVGDYCWFIVRSQIIGGLNENYLEIAIDDSNLYRVKLVGETDTIRVVSGLKPGMHSITLCKNTEAMNGWLEFAGFLCQGLEAPISLPSRKLEFIGNSITCGFGDDPSQIPCDSGTWYDHHNAYLAYGPRTARTLHAQWVLSSVSGIGMIHSCCKMAITMPEVYEKVAMDQDSIDWNFSSYQPDAITICLGQNDGIQDSTAFCSTYVRFIQKVRADNPKALIVCLTSPMGDKALTAALENYIHGIVGAVQASGDRKITSFFFTRSWNSGCLTHPDLEQQHQIAEELTPFLKSQLGW